MTRLSVWTIAVFAAFSSAFGLIYSQLLVKTIMGLSSNFLEAQTVTLGCYIAAMGLGSYLADFVASENIRRRLPQLQLAMALTGLVMVLYVYVVYVVHKFYIAEISDVRAREEAGNITRSLILWSQPVSLIVGVIAGLELNLLLRLVRESVSERGASRVLAGSYAGTVLATLMFVWVMPKMPAQSTSFALAAVNLIFSLYLAWIFTEARDPKATLRIAGWAAAAGALLWFSSRHVQTLQQYEMRVRELQSVQVMTLSDLLPLFRETLIRRPTILRHNTSYQNADFLFLADGGFRFLLDNHIQVERYWMDIYHEGMAHLPIQAYKKIPKRVLILGGGDGILASQLLKYGDRIEHIDLVDLDPWMLHMASSNDFFKDFNHSALLDPKVQVHNTDAVLFLRETKAKYDAVYIDFPLPFEVELVKLFSVEFYQMVAKHLQPGGMVTLDTPLSCDRPDPTEHGSGKWRTGVRAALLAAGFKMVQPFCASDGFLIGRLDNRTADETFTDYGIELNKAGHFYVQRDLSDSISPVQTKVPLNTIFRPLPPHKSREF